MYLLCMSVFRAWIVKELNVRKGMSHKFEEFVRCLLATGGTARATREGLLHSATHFLSLEESLQYQAEVPCLDWFTKQREALGCESYLYTFMRIAGCDTIRQWGFDETKIDGHDTFNQWAMLVEAEGPGKAAIIFSFYST